MIIRVYWLYCYRLCFFFCFQAEDGIRDLVRSRGLGDVYKRQPKVPPKVEELVLQMLAKKADERPSMADVVARLGQLGGCLLYTSDAADERSSVDLGGRRIIQQKTKLRNTRT